MRAITLAVLLAVLPLPLAAQQLPPAPVLDKPSIEFPRQFWAMIWRLRQQAQAARYNCAGEVQARCLEPSQQKWREIVKTPFDDD